MYVHGLSALIIASTLNSAPKSHSTPASSAQGTRLEIEVIEGSTGKAKSSRFGFVIPMDGSVDAWIDREGDGRYCNASAKTLREGLQVELECGGRGHQSLHVRARRTLPLGGRTSIAAVTQTSGANTTVFATLRK